MDLYITYCCGEKVLGINSPEEKYLSPRRIKPFIDRCKDRDLPWAIFSAKYGLFFPWEKKADYDVTFMPVAGYFLEVGVLENNSPLSMEKSQEHVKRLASQIREDVDDHQIERFQFYLNYKSKWWNRGYLAVLHYAVDGCEKMPLDRRALSDHVLQESSRISLFTSVYEI